MNSQNSKGSWELSKNTTPRETLYTNNNWVFHLARFLWKYFVQFHFIFYLKGFPVGPFFTTHSFNIPLFPAVFPQKIIKRAIFAWAGDKNAFKWPCSCHISCRTGCGSFDQPGLQCPRPRPPNPHPIRGRRSLFVWFAFWLFIAIVGWKLSDKRTEVLSLELCIFALFPVSKHMGYSGHWLSAMRAFYKNVIFKIMIYYILNIFFLINTKKILINFLTSLLIILIIILQ